MDITTQIDVYDFNHVVDQIRKFEPRWEAPAPTQAGYKIAREKLQQVSAEPYIKPNPAQQAWIDVGHRQTETATKLADFVRRGLTRYEDFELPSEELSTEDRRRAINKIDARLNEIWEEHSMSDGARSRLALRLARQAESCCDELEAKLAAAVGRIHDLEQQMAYV